MIRLAVNRLAVVAVLLMALPPPLVAAENSYRCIEDVQVCLNKRVAELKKRGWFGMEYDDSRDAREGLVLMRIVPGSPAEAAGLKAGDVIVAMDGVRIVDVERITKFRSESMVPGKAVQCTVLRKGKERLITVTLGPLPSDSMAQLIGMHMLEHAQTEPPTN